MSRFAAIHGHFYQPPRENPWTGVVEREASAAPYHDWNERITAECYAANAAPKMRDGAGRIHALPSSYGRISFDFGPTLLSWLETNEPNVYRAILDADAEGRERFGGHGPAIAQGYNHVILPLASSRDKRTQIYWGIRDFEHRFGRSPEGMWLPETAVDLETLDLLAEYGIRFTILAPSQAARVRPREATAWTDVTGGRIDTSRAWEARLASGRRIALFFYDGALSHGVGFGGLLHNGQRLAEELARSLPEGRSGLAHLATDGETFGHHHKFGDLALATALDFLESRGIARLTVHGEFLAAQPPEAEVEILENTSWSCPHGVRRWAEDCGCATGERPAWGQAWRRPLREALLWLRDALAERFEATGARLFRDPWAARDESIALVLDPSAAAVEAFLPRHAARAMTVEERLSARRILESQRWSMTMFTSCGWFFDDLGGLEPRQVLRYAARAVELDAQVHGDSLETGLLARLAEAHSNDRSLGDGAAIYRQSVDNRGR
jgi:alpha-amylase/alpha-mannosidase (GH57 family)